MAKLNSVPTINEKPVNYELADTTKGNEMNYRLRSGIQESYQLVGQAKRHAAKIQLKKRCRRRHCILDGPFSRA